jgi:predicted transcriptional regulator
MTRKRSLSSPTGSVRAAQASQPAPAPSASWTFLTNHAHVLIVLAGESSLPLREVAVRVGITERAVQRIVAELEAGGVLTRERIGRMNAYTVDRKARLRHDIEAHRTVGDLIGMVHSA